MNREEVLPPPPPGRTGWPWTTAHTPLPEKMPDGAAWPRISLITPSFNQGRYLEETIRSILLQGYPNLEYIVMDGGSADGSVEIIRKYDKWITYWESAKDRGQSHALNKGFARTSGTLLNWLNSDDALLPDALRKVAEASARAPRHLLSGGYVCVWGRVKLAQKNSSGLEADVLAHHWKSRFRWFQGAIFFTREMWETCGPLREDLYFMMDYDLYLKIAARFPVAYVAGLLADYRMHAGAKNVKKSEEWAREICDVAEADWPANLPKPDFQEARKLCYAKNWSDIALRELTSGHFREGWACLKKAYAYSPRRTLGLLAAPQRVARIWWQSRLKD